MWLFAVNQVSSDALGLWLIYGSLVSTILELCGFLPSWAAIPTIVCGINFITSSNYPNLTKKIEQMIDLWICVTYTAMHTFVETSILRSNQVMQKPKGYSKIFIVKFLMNMLNFFLYRL